MPAARLTWYVHPNVMAANVARLPERVRERLGVVLEANALAAEADAKVSAPWQDRTGAARNGLRGTSSVNARQGELVLSHAVDYGVWLELANTGAYAAVIPAMQRAGARVRSDLRGLL